MRRYRIMFGAGETRHAVKINVEDVVDAVNLAKVLGAYSVFEGQGYWQGVSERSIVIEHIGDRYAFALVHSVAEKIAAYLDQAEVWVSEEPVTLTRIVR